ncbi:MAG: NAD(P)-binding domain-containing protein, partial [Anaerolineae bacterium]
MELGLIGLGKMGANMARRLSRGGHRVVGYNRSPEVAYALADEEANVVAVDSSEDLVDALSSPRAAWSMVPAGGPTDGVISSLVELLEPGDIIVDGGNSNYKDTLRRAELVSSRGLHFVDVGVSGGIWGLE